MTLALDGSVIVTGGSLQTFSFPGLTTANTNDVIMVFVVSNFGNAPTVTSATLGTFTFRAEGGTSSNRIDSFYAIAPSSLSNEVINVSLQSVPSFVSGIAFGVSGANTGTPFDSNASLPATGAAAPLTISTTASNTMVIGGFRQSSISNPTAGAGFTLISGANFTCAEYQVTTAAQSALSVGNSNSADVNGAIADAIVALSPLTVTPGAGSIVFTGSAPSVFQDNTVTPSAGSIVFTGSAPTVSFDTVLSPGAGNILFTGVAPTVTNQSNNITVFPGPGVMTFTGFVPGVSGFTTFVGGAPDDQDDYYSWLAYDAEERKKIRKQRLDAMRREIGLLPAEVSEPVIADAEKEIESAVNVVISRQHEVNSKEDFDAITARYQRAYAAAFQSILSGARKSDVQDAFIAEVRKRVVKEKRRQLRIQRDDEEVIRLISGLI